MPGRKGYYRRKLPDGKFEPAFTFDFQYRGVRVSQRSAISTEKEAARWVRERKAEIDLEAGSRRSTKRPDRLTVGQALGKYWADKLSKAQSAHTSKQYQLNTIRENIAADMALETMSTADVAAFVQARLAAQRKRRGEGTVSEATVKAELALLKAMHNWARDVWEYPVRAIAWKVVAPKIPETERPAPTFDHMRGLLMAAQSPRLREVLMFVAMTGLRLGEIRRLTWDKVHLTEARMEVLGKGRKTVQVRLASTAVSLLSSMPRDRSQRVFDMRNFRREWDATRERAGLQHFTFHDLRHFFATALDKMGAPVQHIQTALRHSDISTSLIYTDAAQFELSPYLEKLGQTLQKSAESLPLLKSESTGESGPQSA